MKYCEVFLSFNRCVREQRLESDYDIFSEFNLIRLNEVSIATKFLSNKLYNYCVTVRSTFNTNYT